MPQTQARAVRTAKEWLMNGYPLGTFSCESSQYHKYYTQGSRLTFQVASPVASDRFDSLAKTKFSLARHLNIHYRTKSTQVNAKGVSF